MRMTKGHNNGSWTYSPEANGQGEVDPSNRGYMIVGTSALLALNARTGKNAGNEPQTFTVVLPKLANEGVKIIIPEAVMAAVRTIIHSKDVTSDAPVLRLLDDVEQMRIPNMIIEPSDPVHDSYEATKAAVSRYAGSRLPIYLLTNSIKNDPKKAGRTGMMHLVAFDHPEVNLATTTALVMALAKTGVSHKFGLHSEYFEDLTRSWPPRIKNDATMSTPIDMSGQAYQTLEGVAAKSTGGPLGELIEAIGKTKSARPHVSAIGHRGGLEPAGSHVAAAVASRDDGSDLPPL